MFESFFDWSDEQGLPLRSWADAMQEKGIPPAALLLIPVLLIGAGLYFFIGQGPGTGSVLVAATTAGGDPLPGVSVTLTNAGTFNAQKTTDSTGKASFDSVPAGLVHAVASSPSGVLDNPNFDLTVVPGKQASQSLSLTLQQATGVSLNVDVQNVDAATIILLDGSGNVVNQVADTTATSFTVSPNAQYLVRATGDGLIPDEKTVQVQASNAFVTLVPAKKGSATKARLHVRVIQAGVAGQAVANASVSVLKDGASIASAASSDDGSVPPMTVPYNASLSVSVSANRFLDAVKNVSVSNLDSVVVVALEPQGPSFSGVRLTVQDAAGNPVLSPIVRLYQKGVMLKELLPDDGIAKFNATWSAGLGASVYKPGYLPRYLSSVARDQLVQLASSDNVSAQVRVHVSDYKGQDAPRVSVSLTDAKGQPVGIPARISGSDGVQVFADVPLVPLAVRASDGVRSVSSPVITPRAPTPDSNETDVELQFAPTHVPVPVFVVDHFSRAPLFGAVVSDGNESCTTNSKGACTLSVLESAGASFRVSAPDYQELQSADFAVTPGMAALNFDLTANAVAQNVRLHFDGLFDESGRKVNALTPLTSYQARFILVAPPLAFEKAEAEITIQGNGVFLGGQSMGARVSKSGANSVPPGAAGTDVQAITLGPDGFSQPSFDVVQGGSVSFINQDNLTHFLAFGDGQSVTVPSGQNRSVVFNKVGSFAYKSLQNPAFSGFATVTAASAVAAGTDVTDVLFEYGPFNGSRQIVLQLRTGQNGDLTLNHRSAYITPTDTLRSPSAGLDVSGQFKIDFSGTCTDALCVQFFFLDEGGHKVPKLQLPWGGKGSLVVNLFGLAKSAALSVTATPALRLLSGHTNNSAASVSASSALVAADAGATSAQFDFQAVRLAQDASLHINVTDGATSLFDGDAFIVIFNSTTPSLFVTVQPNHLQALSSTKLVFSVKDFLGQPVDGARVTVADQQAQALDNASGTYVLDNVNPDSLAPVPFQVTADGFRPFSGSIAVQAPDQAVEVTPQKLALSVDAKTPATQSVQLSNKLSDKLHVSISATVQSGGDLTDVSTSVPSLVLAGKGSGSFDLKAAIKDAVLEIARKAGSLKDHAEGTVHIRFSSNGYSDSADVPFTVDSTFAQSSIDDAWSLSPDSVSFALEPPQKKSDSIDLSVTNTAPYALVFNLQQSLGLSVQPASLTLASGAQGAFTLKSTLPNSIDCFSADLHKQGAVTVYGTFQGITSKKNAQVSLDVSTAKLSCQPANGFQVTLPIDVRMRFLALSQTKTNADGSTSVLLPSRELVWFASGASVTPNDANVPQGTAFVLQTGRVQPLPQGGWSIAFPMPVELNIPVDADRQPYGSGQTVVTLDNAQIVLPAGVQAQTPQTGAIRYAGAPVVIPPYSLVVFQPIPFNYNAQLDLMPPDSVEVKLPTDAVLDLPPGTTERKNNPTKTPARPLLSYLPQAQAAANLQNLKAIQLPTGERLAFSDSATVLIDKGLLSVPSGTSMYVSRSRLNAIKGLALSDAFELRMPVWYGLTVTGSPKAFKTQDGQNALKITDQAVVQASWALSVAKTAGSAASVLRVAAERPLSFLTGAFSRVPYDPASIAKCALTFHPPDGVSFSLPKGTVVQKTGSAYEATLPECDDTSRIVFSLTSRTTGSPEIFQTPAVKKLVFSSDSEFLAGDIADAEEKSVRTSSPVQYTACLKDSAGKAVADGLLEAKVTFADKSVVALPERALVGLKENAQDVDLGALTPVSFAGKSSSLGSMGSTKKLKLVSGSGKIQKALPPDYPASGLLMPEGSAIAFVPVCDKGNGRLSVSATADDLRVALDAAGTKGPLSVTFSNKNPDKFKQKVEVCLFNDGKQSVTLDHVESDPDASVAAAYGFFYKAIADPSPAHAYFSQPSVYGNRQKLPVEPSVDGQDNCRKFTLEFNLPDDLVWKGCIAPNKVPNSLSGAFTFKFNDANGDAMASSDKHALAVVLNFDQNPADCKASQEQKQYQDLTGISVNYDKDELQGIGTSSDTEGLFFKNAGQERFFSLINNEEKPITVSEISGPGASLMSCALLDDRQQRSATLLQVGKRVDPSEVLVVSCLSNPGSQGQNGDYVLKFQGESYFLTKTINVRVWNPGPLSSLYPYTAMGKTLPFFSPAQSTVKQRQQIQAAAFDALSFAGTTPDVVTVRDTPTPTPTPTPSAQAALDQVNVQNLLSFRLCKKYFCTQAQATAAISSFAQSFSQLVDARLKNGGATVELTGINAFCRTLQAGQFFQKSTLVQLTNVQLSADDSRSLASALQGNNGAGAYFTDMHDVTVTSSNSGASLFSGCGLYRVTLLLDPACASGGATASAAEWKKQMHVQLNIALLKSCPINLANAALLTADSPNSYSGNQLGTGSLIGSIKQVFSWNTLNAFGGLLKTAVDSGDKSKVASLLDSVGRLRQGVLGTYGAEANDKDALTAKAAFASMYGVDAKTPNVNYCLSSNINNRPCPATPYEDANFCWKTGGPVLTKLGSAVVGVALIQAIFAATTVPASGGSSILLGVRSFMTNYRLITAASGCGAGALAEKFQGKSLLSCRALEACTSSVLAGAVEMANPLALFGAIKPVADEAKLLRSTTFGSAALSGGGSLVLQSLIGAGAVAGIEKLAGAGSDTTPPVVPITITLRQALSPDKVNGAAILAKQYSVQLFRDQLPAMQVETITKSLAKQGLYGAAGRRTAADVVRAYQAAGKGDISKAFDNAAFRAMAKLTPKEQADIVKLGTDQEKIAAISAKLIEKDPRAARDLLLQPILGAADSNAQLAALLETMRHDTSMGSQTEAMLLKVQAVSQAATPASPFRPKVGPTVGVVDANWVEINRDSLLGVLKTDPKSNFLVASDIHDATAQFLTKGDGIAQALLGSNLATLQEKANAVLIQKVGLTGSPTNAEVAAAFATKTPAEQASILHDLGRHPYYQLLADAKVESSKIATLLSEMKTNGVVMAPGDLAHQLHTQYRAGAVTFQQLDGVLTKRGAPALSASFAGMNSLIESSLNEPALRAQLGGRGVGNRISAIEKLQLYDDGKFVSMDTTRLAAAETNALDEQTTAKKLLAADKRAGYIRGVSAFAALMSAFLFDTDFRPVQVQVLADKTNSHVIAVHSENGNPSAESICIKGVDSKCGNTLYSDASGWSVTNSQNVLSVKALCGTSGLCLRLLSWPNGELNSYGLVVGFNGDTQVDPTLLSSIFLPEKAPLTPGDLAKIKMPPGLTLSYEPLTAGGFAQYQPQAPNPQATIQQFKIDSAQAIIDRMNADDYRRSLPNADRQNIISLCNQAISAFRAGKDAEGTQKLKQADDAQTRLLAQGITGGTKK